MHSAPCVRLHTRDESVVDEQQLLAQDRQDGSCVLRYKTLLCAFCVQLRKGDIQTFEFSYGVYLLLQIHISEK